MNYIMEEMPDIHQTGEKKFYPKVQHSHCISNDKIAQRFSDVTSFNRSGFEGVMRSVPDVLNAYLTEGHSVKIDGFGTFNLILGMLSEEEMGTQKKKKVCANQNGVYIKKINFLPEKQWLRGVREKTVLNQVKSMKEQLGECISSEQRLQMVVEYIEANGSMSVRDYMTRTGLGRRRADQELNAFCDGPENGIRLSNVGKTKVYVKK